MLELYATTRSTDVIGTTWPVNRHLGRGNAVGRREHADLAGNSAPSLEIAQQFAVHVL
jgi:hypothetical protein